MLTSALIYAYPVLMTFYISGFNHSQIFSALFEDYRVCRRHSTRLTTDAISLMFCANLQEKIAELRKTVVAENLTDLASFFYPVFRSSRYSFFCMYSFKQLFLSLHSRVFRLLRSFPIGAPACTLTRK